jgi:D-glycero-alpha-D-manno-heptose 1-phosphate guanylyltransferase
MMEAVVLAGGLGTRLRDLVPDVPKPMAPVAGRPFLEILLTHLARKGFNRVVLSVGYLADTILNHFGGSYAGMEIRYEIESQPLGTGGALRQALLRCERDRVFVFNGDTFLDLEVDEACRVGATERQPVIVARAVPDTSRFGVLELDGHRVAGFRERGTHHPGLINAGSYLLPRDIFDGEPLPSAFSLERDFLPTAVERRDFLVFVTRGSFIDIGVPDDYERAQTLLAFDAGAR